MPSLSSPGFASPSSILLTEGSILTIVRREMLRSLQCGEPRAVTKNHAWMCFLLSLLLLYNPFLVTTESSGALSLRHPPSYRATVASSELQKFKSQESREDIAIADRDLLERFALLLPQLRPSAKYCDTEARRPADRFLSGNLWFRPPPAA